MLKIKVIIIVSFLTVAKSSCQNSEILISETWPNQKPKTLIEYTNPQDTLTYNIIGLYETGDTNFVYSISNDKRDGISRYYFENGQPRYIIEYKDDQFHGKSTFWYPNGQLWQTAKFHYGNLVDTLMDYYENGALKSTGIFENGSGELKYFHSNGNKWKTGKLINGKEEGLWTYYYLNGAKLSEGSFRNGLKNGSFTNYYMTGEIMEKGTYMLNIVTENTFYKKNGHTDELLTNFYSENRNLVPWTEEQRESFRNDCINKEGILNQKNNIDYCYCLTDKIELFWSYTDFLSSTNNEYQNLIKMIDHLCEIE